MFWRIISIVFPIAAIVLVGFVHGRRQRPDMQAANTLNITLFLPALFFSALAGKSFDLADNVDIALGGVAVVLVSGVLTWLAARLAGIEARTLVPPSMFNNVGNMGLPLMLLTFGEHALGAAVVLMLVVTVLQFSVGIWLLSGRFNASMLWREPLLVAALAGIAVSLGGLTIWPPLMVAVKLLGNISIGLMIFSLGVRLSGARLGAWRVGLLGACVTPLTGMLAAWLYAAVFALTPQHAAMLFIFGALPPAVSSFIMAERYRQEPDKVASIVIIGNALALFFVPLALALQL